MSAVEGITFPRTSAAALALRCTPEEVAHLTRPEREDRVRHLIGYAQWVVQLAKERHFDRRSLAATCILYSGGNDSTVLAHLFREDADYAVHANTTIGVEATRDFVRSTCRDWGLELLERTPGTSYRELVLEQGFPGPGQHFKMYQRLKERCLEQVRNELIENPYRQRVLFLGGRRRSESRRRADIPATDRRKSMVFASPLVLWTKPDLNTYRLMAGEVPVNEVSDLIHMSGECLCGAFAEKGELEEVGSWFPEVREQIEGLERELEGRTDLPEIRRKWGWGAYRRDLEALKARGYYKSGALCGSCDDRATGGATMIVQTTTVSDPTPTVEPMDDTHCEQDGCPCGGEDVPLHELHAIGYTGVTEDNHSQADPEKGPWFGAMYDGRCSVSECRIDEGDRIRADGQGGYECESCGDPDPQRFGDGAAAERRKHPYVTIPDPPVREVTVVPALDDFEDPTAPADVPDVLNVSGQPKARYQWRGSQNMGYLVKDPTTGDFRRYKNQNPMGWTRATTFNKAASSTTSLTAWKLRNVIIGAARRPDALLRAHGLTHKDARQLDQIAADLEEVAGAKVGSDIGTFLHEFTEHMDAGLKTWRDAPPQYQAQLALYAKTLADAGFEPVPGLIERTTCITEFGGVVGTFDRVLYHRPSGTYAVGDLKTGKTMDYARLETECQEWIYAHGVNQNGVYDWNTDTWHEPWPDMTDRDPRGYSPIKVSEEWGLIIHMPVQGDDAGRVFLERADLQRGARYAETCAENRGWSRPKRQLWSWEPPAQPAPEPQLNPTPDDVWRALFRAVRSGEEATALWRRAKEDGVQGVFLNELIELARESIRSHS